jgi:hypothetical protein
MCKRLNQMVIAVCLMICTPVLGYAQSDNGRALATEFADRYRVSKYLTEADIVANPFAYRGQVIAFKTRFIRMVSESEAHFALNGESSVRVTKVPAELFHGREVVELAVKMLGTTQERDSYRGESAIAYGEFVGAYLCKPQRGFFETPYCTQ